MSDVRAEEALDVRILTRQDLPEEVFPGGRSEPFRVFFTPEVHAAIWRHAMETTAVEICGVLVGTWLRDAAGPFVKVSESIRGEAADTRFAEVTFTHQTWARINSEMDTKFTHLKIVGWYHTHPDFGIFLSDRDRFIQEHFFSGPGQIALVVDPVRKTEGVFVWRGGKPTLGNHYWVGDRVIVGDSAAPEAATGPRPTAEGAGASPSSPARNPESGPALAALMSGPWGLLLLLTCFLLGYLLASKRSSWEERTLAEGTVAHFGIWSILRPGLSVELERLEQELGGTARALDSLKLENQEASKAVGEVRLELGRLVDRVGKLKNLYGYTASEEAAVRLQVLAKLAEISQGQPARPEDGSRSPSGTISPPVASEPGKSPAQPAPAPTSPPAVPAPEKAGPGGKATEKP